MTQKNEVLAGFRATIPVKQIEKIERFSKKTGMSVNEVTEMAIAYFFSPYGYNCYREQYPTKEILLRDDLEYFFRESS